METRDLSLLLALDALLQEANVTRAARRLGLSVPAASHALARIRERLGDPLLVRAGRRLVLTPRAEQLRPEVRSLIEQATRVLADPAPLEPRTLVRRFTVHATDHVLLILGPAVQHLLQEEAPGVSLRVLPSGVDDWESMRHGQSDLSICMPGHFPPECRSRPLLTDRFVCVLRTGHPQVGRRLSLAQYLELQHLVVAPLGTPSVVDAVLAERGLTRRIRQTVPYFVSGLLMAAHGDDVLTVSDRAATAMMGTLPIRRLAPPLPLPDYALYLHWHARFDECAANAWLRSVFLRAAALVGDAVPPDVDLEKST